MNRNFYDFTFFKWILYCRAKTRLIRIDSESRKPSWRQRTPREPRQRRKSERSVGEPRRKGSSKRRIPRSSASGRRRNNADWRRSAPLGWSNSKWKLYDRLRPSRLASAMRRILESCEFIVIIEIFERTFHSKIHVGKIYFVQIIRAVRSQTYILRQILSLIYIFARGILARCYRTYRRKYKRLCEREYPATCNLLYNVYFVCPTASLYT